MAITKQTSARVQVQQNALDAAAREIEASRAAVKKARATDKEVAELRRRLATQPVNPGPGTDPIRSWGRPNSRVTSRHLTWQAPRGNSPRW